MRAKGDVRLQVTADQRLLPESSRRGSIRHMRRIPCSRL
jgi:hypothetical protein